MYYVALTERFRKLSQVFQKRNDCLEFRGNLRYKTRTSQNVSSEANVKNFFIF